ncbi:MAG: hypothetical protein ACU0BN_06020 [Sulfitobacter sp.]
MKSITRSVLRASIFALLFSAGGGVSADTAAGANSLFVRAVEGWQSVEQIAGNDTASARRKLERLKEVSAAIDSIIADHSGSELAVKLIIGETVGPLSVPMLKETVREAELKLQLSECADEPTSSCIIDLAVSIVRDMSGDSSFYYIKDIAISQAQAGLYNESLKTARSIPDRKVQENALSQISIKMAETGDLDQALNLASGLSIGSAASQAYSAIVSSKIELGKFGDAERLFEKIEDNQARRDVLIEYAKALASKGQMETSMDLLTRIDDVYRSAAMKDIFEIQVSEGDYESAWETADNIPDDSYRCQAVVRFGIATDDREIIDRIIESTLNMEDGFHKEICFRTIGIQANRSSFLGEARRLVAERGGLSIWHAVKDELEAGLFEDAYRTALTYTSDSSRSNSLAMVAKEAASAGHMDFAERILAELQPEDEASVRGKLWSIDGRAEHVSRLWKIANDSTAEWLPGEPEVRSFIVSDVAPPPSL